MKIKYVILLVAAATSLHGCLRLTPGYPEYEYTGWEKSGKSWGDVKKALLECGYQSVYDNNRFMSFDEEVLSARCMENQGYKLVNGPICAGYGSNTVPMPPSCFSGAAVPTPSVERRLNSRYCQGKRHDSPECQP